MCVCVCVCEDYHSAPTNEMVLFGYQTMNDIFNKAISASSYG